ncbi:hypothetical protein ACFYP6_29145 [Streptomyces goshikiensis]|uniref:hypothetical protein n=1 Tax=Streptomyces goshikiensis TaxID=1942 RepID=UPI0036A0E394
MPGFRAWIEACERGCADTFVTIPEICVNRGNQQTFFQSELGQCVSLRGCTAEVDERGQESVDEDQLVPCPDAVSPIPQAELQCLLAPFVPWPAHLGDEFADHIGRQPCDPLIADERCTSPNPTTRT